MNRKRDPRGPGRRKGSGARAGAGAAWGLRAVQALGDPSRWRLLEELRAGPATLGQLSTRLGLSLGCTSRHLSILKESELLTAERQGRELLCSLPEPESAGGVLLALLSEPPDDIRYVSNEHPAKSVRPEHDSAIPEFESTSARAQRLHRIVNSIDIEDYLL